MKGVRACASVCPQWHSYKRRARPSVTQKEDIDVRDEVAAGDSGG